MLVCWIISTLIGRYQVGDGRGLQQGLLCFPKKSTVRCSLQSQIQFNLHCDLNEKQLRKRFFYFLQNIRMERQNQHDPENQKSDIMMELSAEQVRLEIIR